MKPPPRVVVPIAASALLVLAMAGCGGATPESQAPESPAFAPEPAAEPDAQSAPLEEEAPAGVDILQREKLREALSDQQTAEAQLGELMGERDAESAAGLSAGETTDRCSRACRALRSLRRSANSICELTSPEDQRCMRARDSVARNGERTRQCGCSEREP